MDLSKYQLVRKGNLVLNNQQAWRGSVGVSSYEGIVSPAYLILELSNKFDPHYANYLFRNGSMVSHYLIASKGVGTIQRNLYWGNLRRTPIFIPPLSEQQKIAQFLDDKTAKIDQAVDLAEKQIALLKEHKQILIQNAVTRGLNPDVPLKDSCVEWIGQVPEHWEVKKLKFVLTLSNKKEESKNSNKRYIGMENIESFTGKINDIPLIAEGIANSFYKDEILFGKLRPYLAKSYLADFDGICSTEFLVYRSTKVLNNRFALNIFLSYGFIDAVNASTYGSKMPRANAEFISNMFLAIPPLSEQKQIIDYLDKQTAKIDQAIALKTAHIEKLKEYKSVLINDVVTGKVRV